MRHLNIRCGYPVRSSAPAEESRRLRFPNRFSLRWLVTRLSFFRHVTVDLIFGPLQGPTRERRDGEASLRCGRRRTGPGPSGSIPRRLAAKNLMRGDPVRKDAIHRMIGRYFEAQHAVAGQGAWEEARRVRCHQYSGETLKRPVPVHFLIAAGSPSPAADDEGELDGARNTVDRGQDGTALVAKSELCFSLEVAVEASASVDLSGGADSLEEAVPRARSDERAEVAIATVNSLRKHGKKNPMRGGARWSRGGEQTPAVVRSRRPPRAKRWGGRSGVESA